jgi:hypothetical protein
MLALVGFSNIRRHIRCASAPPASSTNDTGGPARPSCADARGPTRPSQPMLVKGGYNHNQNENSEQVKTDTDVQVYNWIEIGHDSESKVTSGNTHGGVVSNLELLQREEYLYAQCFGALEKGDACNYDELHQTFAELRTRGYCVVGRIGKMHWKKVPPGYEHIYGESIICE